MLYVVSKDNEIYIGQLRQESNGQVRIVYTLAGGGTEGHLHDRYHRNIYYTWFDPHNRHFHSASAKPVQRIEIVENFRGPARAIFSGASSQRDVAIADGDISVAGIGRR